MNSLLRTAPIALLVFAHVALAQSARDASGHWEGAIQVPGKDIAIQVDLAKSNKGEWMGAIDIPSQNAKGFPLSSIAVKGSSVAFVMKGIPGDPSFDGTLSANGKSLSGNFTQGGAALTFALKRTADARIETRAKSTSITKTLEGTWEGTLDAGAKHMRLILKMLNQADGTAGGTIVSVDEREVEIPLTTITQKDSRLKLELNSIGAAYSGELKDDELVGEWTQGPGNLPLTFKHSAKPLDKK
jgi:hypothetical protein